VGELAAAVRNEGMVFGVSSHRAEHWWFMNGGMTFDSDVQDPQYQDLYGLAKPGPLHHEREAWKSKDWQPRPDGKYLEDWLARTCELVDMYQMSGYAVGKTAIAWAIGQDEQAGVECHFGVVMP
jgi:alpha-L-fucosidase